MAASGVGDKETHSCGDEIFCFFIAAVCVRLSWQPTQLAVSPGITWTWLRIRLIARSSSPIATKKIGRMAGTSKYAEPSGPTGTSPKIRVRTTSPR
jgi:hypothetical protein